MTASAAVGPAQERDSEARREPGRPHGRSHPGCPRGALPPLCCVGAVGSGPFPVSLQGCHPRPRLRIPAAHEGPEDPDGSGRL